MKCNKSVNASWLNTALSFFYAVIFVFIIQAYNMALHNCHICERYHQYFQILSSKGILMSEDNDAPVMLSKAQMGSTPPPKPEQYFENALHAVSELGENNAGKTKGNRKPILRRIAKYNLKSQSPIQKEVLSDLIGNTNSHSVTLNNDSKMTLTGVCYSITLS